MSGIKNKSVLADVSMIFIAMIWGASFVVIKDSVTVVSPYWLIAGRFVPAALLSLACFGKRLRTAKKRDVLGGIFAGVVIYFGFILQTIGAKHTTGSKNALITATYVVMVPFLVWIFKHRRPRGINILAAVICLAGIAMLTVTNGFSNINIGDWLTLGCGLIFALHFVIIDSYVKDGDTLIITILQLAACAAVATLAACIFEPHEVASIAVSRRSLLSIGYLAVFPTFVAYVVQTTAQKYTAPSHAALILSLEAVFGCIFSVLFFGDKFTPVMIVGCVMAFGSVLLTESGDLFMMSRNKRRNK